MKKSGIILSATALIVAVVALGINLFNKNRQVKYLYEPAQVGMHQVQLAESTWPDFTFAAEHAIKAVVHVKVVKKGQEVPYSIFDFFFGQGAPQQPMPRDQVGSGSGVIISEDGYIVTNNHVIDGADEVMVTLENNRSFTAKVIGNDPVTDIAVIKIDAQGLPFLKFGDSDALRLGQWVLAIGNPYNLTSTITAGIVSAKGRSGVIYDNSFKIESFIQTDAAVNSGNSGGALITVTGELIGINTAIATRTGDFAGYSFAIPSSIAKKVVEDIMQFGTVQRALLGIVMQELTDELAKEHNIKQLRGVYIAEVSSGGAAEKAGIQTSDVLLSINNVPVNSGSAVQEQINRFRPNDKIELKVLRQDKELTISAVLQNRAGNTLIISSPEDGLSTLLGAKMQPAGAELRKKLGIRSGVEVISLSEGRLKKAGIEEGFVITHVNQTAVGSVKDLETALEKSARRGALIEGKYPDGTTAFYGLGL